MLCFYGKKALSEFRLQQLAVRLRKVDEGILGVEVNHVYFIETNSPLSTSDKARLFALINTDSDDSNQALIELNQLEKFAVIVVPRLGTISPWSSKATEIIQQCDLERISRIERGTIYQIQLAKPVVQSAWKAIEACLYDRMTETILTNLTDAQALFQTPTPRPAVELKVLEQGEKAVEVLNVKLGMALSKAEQQYLLKEYQYLSREPTDAELMMFAQANSEHCRHKLFNANWVIDGQLQRESLFSKIKSTYQNFPCGMLSVYKDNAAILQGPEALRLFPNTNKHYQNQSEAVSLLIKVETHNHPTAISPYAGAATGAGGEIRDEGACGIGGKPKAGLTGFCVSNLKIPGFLQPWEKEHGKPQHIDSALRIMLEGPIGASAFNNEFGRPNICGFFRTYEHQVMAETGETTLRGYHKPIMLAGGMGNMRDIHCQKKQFKAGDYIGVLGGPAFLIGLGGGAASSMAAGSSTQELDYASVQRHNPEIQRRCQEVIDACIAKGEQNPILAIHDVGAGGLSNAVPELVHESHLGVLVELRDIPSADNSLSPMEIWCNEAQERYVVAISRDVVSELQAIAERENCPFAIIGQAIEEKVIKIHDRLFNNEPLSFRTESLFGNPPKETIQVCREKQQLAKLNLTNVHLEEALHRVLSHPSVAAKHFLITIGDRTVTGLVARDQMVGPWQVPVADCGVTATHFECRTGEAMAIGERPVVALIDPKASAKLAVGEVITNLACAQIEQLSDIKLSANWMVAAGESREKIALFDAVTAMTTELCHHLNLTIPVGKDSVSMQSVWENQGKKQQMLAPLSVVVSGFAPVTNIKECSTPQLQTNQSKTVLLLIDLAKGHQRLGGSVLAQVYEQVGHEVPTVEDPQILIEFFNIMQRLKKQKVVLSYHDRSDGGLWATVCEMAFAGHTGVTIDLSAMAGDPIDILLNEELGVVIQVLESQLEQTLVEFNQTGLTHSQVIGFLNQEDKISIINNNHCLFESTRATLQQAWTRTSYEIQALRDNPVCAQSEFDTILDESDPGLTVDLTFPWPIVEGPYIHERNKPKIAILREQGVNGQLEMAAAFQRAGFECFDVHMNDLAEGKDSLEAYVGLAVCGGFSYGDVLGAGLGWAKRILFNEQLKDGFYRFFNRSETFTLGVCNGCQMLSGLKSLIPGATSWPSFIANQSAQFEARASMVQVQRSPSILLQNMIGSKLPIAVAHGEGQVMFSKNNQEKVIENQLLSLSFIDNYGQTTTQYPANPNGSVAGMTGFTSQDGRVTIMMPHPERVFKTYQHSWYPDNWGDDAPWLQLFYNARDWVKNN